FPTRGRLPSKVRAADLDRDGKIDLVVSHCYTDDTIVIFFGDGGFRFSVSQEIMLGKDRETAEQEIRDIVVDDLTGNGRPDIAAACYGSGEIAVLINTGGEGNTGAGRLPFRRETYSFENSRPRALCTADFNQNGKKDLAVALWQSNAVGLLISRD
ncbi:MAG: VCBS repeat-containing protein, partial [Proteobacteria bacterium]|nr:VCBS repeat-containing protein [Pseudomonadota bacterium]